jgi:hypothetical protein
MPAAVRVCLLSLCLLATGVQPTQLGPVYGADSPQALVAMFEKAMAVDDFAAIMPLISPTGRKELAEDAIGALIVALNYTDPDNPAPGSTISESERDTKRKNHRAAVEVARDTLRPHGLDGLIGESPITPLSKDVFELALTRTDTVLLMQSLFPALDRISVLLGTERNETKLPASLGKITDFQIQGDSATAKANGGLIEFERLQGRWYLKPPDR